MLRSGRRYNSPMSSTTESDSIRELTEFAIAWSLKHNKCFVGLEVDPSYAEDPSQMDFANPRLITTVGLSALAIVLRRAQFSVCANMAYDPSSLVDLLRMTTQAGDWQSEACLVRAAQEVALQRDTEAAGVVAKPVPGTPFSIIDGGLASKPKAQHTKVPVDRGPYNPPTAS